MNEIPKKYSILTTDKETLAHWYELMTLGRQLDDKARSYMLQSMGWSFHASYAGHDGIQLAIGQVFDQKKDFLFPYYRDMLTALSAGLTAEDVILNGLSKATDPGSGGRNMSNHFHKPSINVQNVSSSVGSFVAHAVGTARSIKYYEGGGVAIASQGDATMSEGYVYEAINGAAREKLPFILVIQDNGYGISVPKHLQTANKKVAYNYSGLKDLRIIECNGKDVFSSMNAMEEAKRHALETSCPVLVQANCVRIGSHSNSDDHSLYRDKYELQVAKDNDPLQKFRRMLLRYERFTEEELLAIEKKAKQTIREADKKAVAAPDPDPSTVLNFVNDTEYPASKYPDGIPKEGSKGEKMTLVQALNSTLKAEFRHNPNTFIYGQDVAYKNKGGVFNVTKGMQQEFGEQRVFSAPIAEAYIVGTANGMSRFDDKIHVVIEGAEFADYYWPAMEQHVSSTHDFWRSNGQFAPNMTIRLSSGGYIQGGLYHSQNIEGALSTIPGARIVYPTFADDAAGLLRTCIRSKGITIFMEPKRHYNSVEASAFVPEDFEVPFGKGRIRREGSDLTLVTYGNTLPLSIEVADQLAKEGVGSIEVIDLRSIVPWDKEMVHKSLEKTGKVLIVHEDKVHSGFGAEISASITSEWFQLLDAPVKRVGSLFTPVGFHKSLENAILPQKEDIYVAAKELLEF